MHTTIFTGAATALVTPMTQEGKVNFCQLQQLVHRQIQEGADAIVVASVTGEGPTLTPQEHQEVISCARAALEGTGIPLIAGSGSNCTQKAIALCKGAQQAGADAVLLVTPYYNKTSQEGLLRHFCACAAAVELPILLHNAPDRTGMALQPQTCRRLLPVGNIQALVEESGDPNRILELLDCCQGELDLYAGRDSHILPLIALGGKGAVSVLGNLVPGEVRRLCHSALEGNLPLSAGLQRHYHRLIQALHWEADPIPVKAALQRMGWQAGPCRSPLCPLEDRQLRQLDRILEEYGLLPVEER